MPKAKITKEEFERRIKERFPLEHFIIKEYESLGKPAIIECGTCHKDIRVNVANNFLAKNKRYGCKNCFGYWKEREQKINKIKELYDILEIKIPTDNHHTHKRYVIKCKNCGHIREATLNNLYSHLECGCKTGVYRDRTPEEFIKQVNEATLDSYSLIGNYNGQSSKVKLRHNPCGFIIEKWAHDAIAGKISCPHCHQQESQGERIIGKYLQSKNIDVQREIPLKNNTYMRFDFLLDDKIAIEYNGAQHYKEVDYFHGTLADQQRRDEAKREYCRQNNIILYEISYNIPFSKVKVILDGIINRLNDYPNGVDSSESKSCLSVDLTDKDIVSSHVKA